MTQRTIEIVIPSGKKEVTARMYAGGALAVHRAPGRVLGSWSRWFNITHVETGLSLISAIENEPAARAIASALAGTGVLWAHIEASVIGRDRLRHDLGPDLWHWFDRLRREGIEREERADAKGEAACG